MKNKKLDGVQIWKQFEDLVIPRLHLSVIERAVYSHLLRHSRFEGKAQLRFSILWLARSAGLSDSVAREAVRSLVAKGALHLAERSRTGHLVEVRLPEEIPLVCAEIASRGAVRVPEVDSLVEADFLEGGNCARRSTRARGGAAFTVCAS
jgi:hypothetical protein